MYPFFPTRLEMENKKNRENKWNTTILMQHEAIHYPCQLKLSERCLSSRNRCAMPRPIIWHDSKHSLFMQMIISNIVSIFLRLWSGSFLHWGSHPFPTVRKQPQRIGCPPFFSSESFSFHFWDTCGLFTVNIESETRMAHLVFNSCLSLHSLFSILVMKGEYMACCWLMQCCLI